MKSRIGLIIALIILSILFSISPVQTNEEAEKAALATSNKWLALVDKGDYFKSWDQAAEIFKKMVIKEEWQTKLNAYRMPLGKVSERKVMSKQYTKTLPDAPEGEYVVLQYETVFTSKQTITETITSMLEKDGKWRVAGYYITLLGQESQPSGEKKK